VLVYRLLISPQPAKLRWLHDPPLDAVLATPKLIQRLSRTPDFESESRFLGILAQTLAGSPRSILQKLADETPCTLQRAFSRNQHARKRSR
jgi:hypothetical protein